MRWGGSVMPPRLVKEAWLWTVISNWQLDIWVGNNRPENVHVGGNLITTKVE